MMTTGAPSWSFKNARVMRKFGILGYRFDVVQVNKVFKVSEI